MKSLRVEPEIAQDVSEWAGRNNILLKKDHNPGDLFPIFQGSNTDVARLQGFVDGWKACRQRHLNAT